MKLSLGARHLLGFLTKRGWKNGYSWYRQDQLARHFHRDVRTVGRWVSELTQATLLKSERHGHGNYYFVQELSEKMSDRASLSTTVVENCENQWKSEGKLERSVRSDQTKMSDRKPFLLITETYGRIQNVNHEKSIQLAVGDDCFSSLPKKPPNQTPGNYA